MTFKTLGWSSPETIASNEVHIYCSYSLNDCFNIENFREVLSHDEIIRAGNFHFEKDRAKFIQSRGTLRTLLARYLKKKPEEIQFNYSTFGRPVLSANNNYPAINFNLSHSGDVVLYAITQNTTIGIDVEQVNDHVQIMQVAGRFFSPGEMYELAKASKIMQPELFYKYWVRKEAIIKGLGKGFSFPLEKIDVSSIDGNSLYPVLIPGNQDNNHSIYVQDLFPGDGYVGAIATEKGDSTISFYTLS